jgi:hypothetical protein
MDALDFADAKRFWKECFGRLSRVWLLDFTQCYRVRGCLSAHLVLAALCTPDPSLP